MTTTDTNTSSKVLRTLIVAALGVVYGDIGTSPLYAFRLCFSGKMPVTADNILGVLSLVFWALVLMISIKYVTVMMRADNKGEGGILTLMTLVHKNIPKSFSNAFILLLGMLGACMLYGDGLITPAISVLSAVEGLNIISPQIGNFVIPISVAILIGLFLMQRHGSGTVGAVFGPIMLIWFGTLSILGICSAVQNPLVFLAINPLYAFKFLMQHGLASFATLSTVFLVLSGGEALYADMGHFGRTSIRRGWFMVVMPSIVLNYFGQGAYLLRNPLHVDNLFYRLAPAWAGIPLVILATMATIIASQAMISGAFTVTRQASQLGFLPRISVRHTSSHTMGQIYVPVINWLLLAGTLLLLLNMRKSDDLANAYGVSVTSAMLIDSVLLFFFLNRKFGWHALLALLAVVPFLFADSVFFAANLAKITQGGWIPLTVAIVMYVVMTTWRKAYGMLSRKIEGQILPEDLFISDVSRNKPHRVKGTAIFLSGTRKGIPRTLLHNYKHNMIIHDKVVLLTVVTKELPTVEESKRCEVFEMGENFFRVIMSFGYSEDPDVPKALASIKHPDLQFREMATTYFLGRETLLPGPGKTLSFWRKQLFFFLSRNAFDASKFFHIPVNRVVEIGIQMEL